jgi:RNA-directed DNA polymerase
MKRIGNIYEKICSIENLERAYYKASRGKKRYKAVKWMNARKEEALLKLHETLLQETYEVSPYQISILKDVAKDRKLMKLPLYPDRIVQWAIMLQLNGMFMKSFVPLSHAAIKGRGIHSAKRTVQKYLDQDREGTKYCLKFDIKKFYENIDHQTLKNMLRRKIKDARLLRLLDKIIDSVDGEKGLPIGSLLSQNLANFYLTHFDNYLKHELRVKYVIRYMDDVVILNGSKEYLHDLFNKIKAFMESVKLDIKENWQIFPVEIRGIDFVGYRMFGKYTLLRKRILVKFKKRINKICRDLENNGEASRKDVLALPSYNGWLKHCDSYRVRQKYAEKALAALGGKAVKVV